VLTNRVPTFNDIEKAYNKVQDLSYKYWLHESLYSFNWWFMVILTIFIWVIWFKFVKKSELIEIILGGCMISLVTLLLDLIGVNLNLWNYPTLMISNFYPTLLPVDVVVIPVTYMFMYQFFKSWKIFIIASVVVSAGYSFIAEPIFHAMDIYRLKHWQYIYSFPIYIVLFLFIRWFVVKVKAITDKN
jgi:hypothetical protein